MDSASKAPGPGCRCNLFYNTTLHYRGPRDARPSVSATHSAMALARPLPSLWQTLLPTLNGPVRPVINLPLLQRLTQPFRLLPTPFAALALPSLSLPSFPSLWDIWEGVLKAVPKKKTSHMKKRHRFMAGKAIKEITALNRCPACRRVKRAHILCPFCVNSTFGSLSLAANELTNEGSYPNQNLRHYTMGGEAPRRLDAQAAEAAA